METKSNQCKVVLCDRPAKTRGYCSAHFQRHLAGRDMTTPIRQRASASRRPEGVSSREWAIASLKRAAQDREGPLSAAAYDAWQLENRDAAHRTTIHTALGTWAQACEAAEVSSGKAPAKRVYHKQFTDEQCDDAVRQFLASGERVSFTSFERWISKNPGHPSPQTVRNRAARRGMSWSALLEKLG